MMKYFCSLSLNAWATCRIATVLSLTLASNTAISQVSTHVSALDSLPKHCHFSAKFDQQKTLKSLPIPLKSTGQIYFSCNDGLIWETQAPIRESLILTRSEYQFKQQGLLSQTNGLEVLDSIESRFLSRLLIGLMSSDKNYIEKTFEISSLNTAEFILKPKDQFISKAIKTVQIKHQVSPEVLSISINHTDDTQVNIDTHNVIVLPNDNVHMQQCLDTGNPEQHCIALFDPAKMAILLNENSGN